MKTTFVVYRSEKRVFVTTKESEAEFLKQTRGWKERMGRDYDRTEILDMCVSVESTLNWS